MKKGQIYILAVIILGFILYTIITPVNFMHQRVIDDDFEEISRNYEIESTKLVNEQLNVKHMDKETLENIFLNFTIAFTSYSKTKNPSFGLIYAFPYQEKLFIGNYADIDINFTAEPKKISLQGCLSNISTTISIAGLNLATIPINTATYKKCVNLTDYPDDNTLKFKVEDVQYNFTISENRSEVIVVTRERLSNDIKIFISE
jgi:hypothetical protein